MISSHLPFTVMYTSTPFSGSWVGGTLPSRAGNRCHLFWSGPWATCPLAWTISFSLLVPYRLPGVYPASSSQILFLPVSFLACNLYLSHTLSPSPEGGHLRVSLPPSYSNGTSGRHPVSYNLRYPQQPFSLTLLCVRPPGPFLPILVPSLSLCELFRVFHITLIVYDLSLRTNSSLCLQVGCRGAVALDWGKERFSR